jgi:aspartyl protease family protein
MDENDLDREEGGKPKRQRRSPLFQLAGGMVVFCIIGVVLVAAGRGFLPQPPPERPHASAMMAGAAATSPLVRSASYRADGSGHYFVDAVVNGVRLHFLVDTGASYVALTPKDALAAGLTESSLRYSMPLNTAHGVAHAAPVVLRQVRLQQLELNDVAAVVMDQPMATSLLGMSFLSRLDGYSIRDGVLTIEW